MARRKREEEHENHERWLVSYADFITLLFAFFVVMYAISQVNEGKYRVLSDSLFEAFRPDGKPGLQPRPETPSGDIRDETLRLPMPKNESLERRRAEAKMRAIADQVSNALDALIKSGEVQVTQTERGIVVDISAAVLFASGQAEISESATRALNSVASVLAGIPNGIEVEGHTDNTPISNTQFPSNWELSAARASRVVRWFAQNGVAPERLAAVGFGEFRGIDDNATVAGKSRNRRVSVVIAPPPQPRGRLF